MAAQQADQDLLGGRLAGAAGAEEPEDLATADGEIHSAYGRVCCRRIGEGEPSTRITSVVTLDDAAAGVKVA